MIQRTIVIALTHGPGPQMVNDHRGVVVIYHLGAYYRRFECSTLPPIEDAMSLRRPASPA